MPIFRAVGFGIFIITLRVLVPDVFEEGRHTASAFLHGASISADTAARIAASATTAMDRSLSESSAGTPQQFMIPQAIAPVIVP